MGICASCLGQNRHPSHDQDGEIDRLLEDGQHARYGTTVDDDVDSEQDEQEVRREREALEQITARAADNMINVLHADQIEADQHHLTPNLSFLSLRGLQAHGAVPHITAAHEEQTDEEIEQAWLRDAHVGGDTDNDVTLKGSYGGNLVMDLSRLRQNDQSGSRREV